MNHRHAYLIIWMLLAFVTAVDGGLLAGLIPATPDVHVAAIVVNLALGVVSAALPAWFDTQVPLPPPPPPPPTPKA